MQKRSIYLDYKPECYIIKSERLSLRTLIKTVYCMCIQCQIYSCCFGNLNIFECSDKYSTWKRAVKTIENVALMQSCSRCGWYLKIDGKDTDIFSSFSPLLKYFLEPKILSTRQLIRKKCRQVTFT